MKENKHLTKNLNETAGRELENVIHVLFDGEGGITGDTSNKVQLGKTT